LVFGAIQDCRGGGGVLAGELPAAAPTNDEFHERLLRHDAAGGGGGGGRGEPDDPQVADRPAAARWAALGVGRLQRHARLLSWELHARVELRAGHPAPVPVARTDAARDGIPGFAERRGAPDVPVAAADPAAGA